MRKSWTAKEQQNVSLNGNGIESGKKQEQTSENMFFKVLICYRVWQAHLSEGIAEKRAAVLMSLLDVKTHYDANRRIARLPLTGKLGLGRKIKIFDAIKNPI